ncbi:uncharacterized protein CTRU02_211870 [Colletotrichum truncatum]|uniref:Uncharacterized protein n=1 Tax=Colletotrichum truncatum TaxID=5467 RepID=A0ACC3YM43_COLTU|nr:uncharacterized protein CTRU02_07280 [Colletotrichum truncatum]KAF6791518.1 hypothetical protein CTRU02_07280 [Colletotrichum truncatum]
MRRGGIEPPAPRRCLVATENFTTKPSALLMVIICLCRQMVGDDTIGDPLVF